MLNTNLAIFVCDAKISPLSSLLHNLKSRACARVIRNGTHTNAHQRDGNNCTIVVPSGIATLRRRGGRCHRARVSRGSSFVLLCVSKNRCFSFLPLGWHALLLTNRTRARRNHQSITRVYLSLSLNCDQIVQTLSRDKSLDAFRIEYEKLYRTLKHSHEQEKKLEKKCKSLSEECRQLTAKEERLRVHSREDETQIEALKAELESAWRQVDEASDLEMAGKEQIAKLRVEIAELTRRCEMAENGEEEEDTEDDVSREFIGEQQNITRPGAKKRCGETGGEYSQNLDDGYFGSFSTATNASTVSGDIVRRLQREKDSLQLERDDKVDEIVQLRQEISQQRERARAAETKKLDLECECTKLKDIARLKRLEAEKSDTKRERLERELMHAKSMVESKQGEISRMKAQAANLE